MTISRLILLRLRNVSSKCVEKIKVHILCSVTFLRKSCCLWDHRKIWWVPKWRRVSCLISKATYVQAQASALAPAPTPTTTDTHARTQPCAFPILHTHTHTEILLITHWFSCWLYLRLRWWLWRIEIKMAGQTNSMEQSPSWEAKMS
jgi:hypothetical protein